MTVDLDRAALPLTRKVVGPEYNHFVSFKRPDLLDR
jgi:hypothetical protein